MQDSSNSPPIKQKVKIDPKELVVKYKRLAEDYNKLIQSNAVLKKAILEEQNSKEFAQALKEKEIRIRTIEEENDLLTFNNDRLTKRVAFLQNCLEEAQSQKSSGWFKWGGGKEEMTKAQEKITLLTETLEASNKRQAELDAQVNSIKQEQEQTVSLLSNKMLKIKEELEAKQQEKIEMEAMYQRIKDELTLERDIAYQKLKEANNNLLTTQQMLEEKKQEIIDIESRHQLEMKKSRDIIFRQVIFDDTKIPRFNTLNLPMYDRSVETKLRDAITLGTETLSEFTTCLCSEANTENDRLILLKKLNRSGRLDPQLISIYDKISELLSEYSQNIEPVRECFLKAVKEFREKGSISDFMKKSIMNYLNLYVLFHQNLSYWKQSGFQEESKQRDCVRAIQQLNAKLQSLCNDYHNGLERLIVSISLLCGNHNTSNKEFVIILQRIHETLKILESSRKEYHTVLATKFSKEHEDHFINPKKKSANISVENSAEKSAQCLEKIEKILGEYVNILANPPPRPVRGALLPPNSGLLFNDHEKLRNRASKFMNIINSQVDEITVIPYPIQLDNLHLIKELQDELTSTRDIVNRIKDEKRNLEQEKNKLVIDLSESREALSEKKVYLTEVLADLAETRQQLLNFQQTKQNVSEVNNQPRVTSSNGEGYSNGEQQLVVNKWSLTVMDETGNQTNSLNVSVSDREREQKLKQYYQEKHALLEAQLHTADAKLVDLFERKEQLEQQLQQVKDERDFLQERLRETQSTAIQSLDELDSTKKNYEQQLKYLMDHVVELNEKIEGYKEEIDSIKKFKVRCGKCKIWNTIEWLITEGKNGRNCSNGNHPSSLNYA